MKYAIIGAGNVGTALARHFARNAIPVGIANSRSPETLGALTQELGSHVTALTLQEAVQADHIILAVPFRAHPSIARMLSHWQDKIIIDAMNTYGVPIEELQGQASSHLVATAFKGAKLVKTLNQLPAKLLAAEPAENGGRRVMFLASDDEVASATVGHLLADLGFAPIHLGKIEQGGALLGMGAPLILQNLIKLG